MNEAGRGFSVESQAAAGAPLDVMRGRARRPRFFSGSGAVGRGAAATAGAAAFATPFVGAALGPAGFGAATAFAGGADLGDADGFTFPTGFEAAAFAFGATGFPFFFRVGFDAGFVAFFGAIAFAAFLTALTAVFAAAFTFEAAFFAGFAGFGAGFAAFLGATLGAEVLGFFGATFFFAAEAALFALATTFFAAPLEPAAAAFFPCTLAMNPLLRTWAEN